MTTTPEPLTAVGLQVLLIFRAGLRAANWHNPGLRVTQQDEGVLVEAHGFTPAWSGEALTTLDEAVRACQDAGLDVHTPAYNRVLLPARVVRRRPLC